jgi:copper(I)-binding protein
VCVVAWLAGCGGDSGSLVASNVLVPAPIPGREMTAGYLTLENRSDAPVTVTGVSSPQFGIVEMHDSTVANGVSRMRQLREISVPPGSSVQFAPGGKHLMLMKPVDDIQNITLHFLSGDNTILIVNTEFGS